MREISIRFLPFVILCVTVGWLPSTVRAQDIKVQASVSNKTIGTEEAVTYTIQVEGSDGTNISVPPAPEAEGLTLLQSIPGTQRSVSIVNGVMAQSFGFTWTFRPTAEGRATIGATTIQVGDQSFHTQPVTINVVAQTQRPTRQQQRDPFSNILRSPFDQSPEPVAEPTKEDIFIRALPSSREAFQGEQVTVEYRLYFREGIQLRQSRLTDSWDAEGFWREELDVETRPIPRIVVENGLRYNTIVLKRAAVFPTRAGEMSVDPLKIESEALLPFGSRDPFQSLFAMRTRFTPVQLASPRVKIDARPLPAGAPASFNGAVGSYAMTVVPDRTELQVGESVTLTINLARRGNLATLDSPNLEVPAVFDQYDPDVSSLLDRAGRQLSGSKTYRYVLIPRSNGTFEIPSIEFSFFDPVAERYRTSTSSPIPITVTGMASTPAVVSATTNGMPVDDFAPLFVSTSEWSTTNRPTLHTWLWAYLLILVPITASIGAYVVSKQRDRFQKDHSWARGRRAHPLSKKHLKQATLLLASGDTVGYYEELERAVLGFVGNRLNVAERGLTREGLDDLLGKRGIESKLRERLRRFLDACDQGRFAPSTASPENKEEALDDASFLIPEIDERVSA